MTKKSSKENTDQLDDEVVSDETTDTTSSEDSSNSALRPTEYGGTDKPEPTRYGDWEVDGRCTDF